MKALIASADQRWRSLYAEALLKKGCDVHTASLAFEGIDLLRKQVYDIVLVDDSFPDVSPAEFSMYLRDFASNDPIALVAGENLKRVSPVLRHCEVFFVGDPEAVLHTIGKAVRNAQSRVTV